jgi:plastocyanin
MKRFSLFVVAVGALALVGCQPDAPADTMGAPPERAGTPPPMAHTHVHEFEIAARDHEFFPNELAVAAGDQITIVLNNQGQAPHNIVFEFPMGDQRLESDIQPGESGRMTFNAPTQPGTYTFYCPVGDHREHGMSGRLTVEPGHAH